MRSIPRPGFQNPIAGILAAALAAALSAGPVVAQTPPGTGASRTAAANPDRVVTNRSLGCTLVMPEDGRAVVAGGDELQLIRILQKDADPPAWEIVVRAMRLPEEAAGFGETTNPPPAAMMKYFLGGASEANELMEIESRQPETEVAGLPAAAATASFSHESGRVARFDWRFVKTGPNRFVFVQCLGERDRWPASVFDGVLDSLEILTEPELAISAMTIVDQGRSIIGRLDPDALREAARRLEDVTYYRLHAFDQDGNEVEFGYAGVKAWETDAGAVGRADPAPVAGADDLGLMVRVQLRILPPSDKAPFRDIDHKAWVSWDREAERWMIQETDRARDSDLSRTNSILGLRPRPTAEEPRRWLQVVSQGRETLERYDLKVDVPQELDLYLSEAERLILPTLLDVVDAPSGEFAVWAWNEDRESISRRLEGWTPDAQGSSLESRTSADARPALQRADRDGIVVRRDVPIDGRSNTMRWSRTDGKELRNLYERKGIPFDG